MNNTNQKSIIDLENIPNRDELIKILKPSGKGIEIGVQQGVFAKHILENCTNLELYLLDCWQNQKDSEYHDIANVDNQRQAEFMKNTISNVSNFFHNVKIIKGYSDQCVNFFEDNFFDFIYIDANHSYEAMKNDINKWFPKIKKGGLFAGHDYLDAPNHEFGVFGVKSAVDEFALQNNLKVYPTQEPHDFKSWFIIR
jgi:hypothetical protein